MQQLPSFEIRRQKPFRERAKSIKFSIPYTLIESTFMVRSNLNINKPELIESNKIKIILSNSSQVELIEQEKINILTYLRNSLNNDLLELETQVKEIDKNDVPYTNSDKYKKMFEENENLAMKEKMNYIRFYIQI